MVVVIASSQIGAAVARAGLAYRGGFHSEGEGYGRSIVLVGFAGDIGWPAFAASAEAEDGRPDPLDRWSRRVVGALATELGAAALFPFDGPPYLPFQRWAQLSEPVHPSPLGLLIHPDWGLWHSYRGALAFTEWLQLPGPDRQPSPCDRCSDKPCLTACPVGAFSSAGYDVVACSGHIGSSVGAGCIDSGCMARRACPVAAENRYHVDRAAFYMRAFRSSVLPNSVR